MPRWSSRLQRLVTVGLWFESKWNLKFNQRESAEQGSENRCSRGRAGKADATLQQYNKRVMWPLDRPWA